MLSESVVKQLKQVDISKDPTKTAARIKEVFSPASRDDKNAVIKQMCQKRNSLYRAEQKGSANARIILALSEVFNVSPYYLDGSSDEKGTCSDETVKEYLLEKGYKKLVASLGGGKSKSRRRSKKAAAQPEAEAVPIENTAAEASRLVDNAHNQAVIEDMQATMFRVTINETDKMREAARNLDLQSATQLLEALFIRSKAGGNAERLCEVVKHCLLS